MFCVLYLCLVVSVRPQFYNLKLSVSHAGRILAFVAIAVCSFPFCLMAERLLRYVQGSFQGSFYGTIVSFMAASVFYALFVFGYRGD